MNHKREIRCFDLFSGIGGFRQGATKAMRKISLNTTWVSRCDIDPYANKLYDHCYKIENELLLTDIKQVTGTLNPKKLIIQIHYQNQ